MTIAVGLAAARKRMNAYLDAAGARATISRKVGDAWTVVASDVPVMIETRSTSADRIDPATASPDDANRRDLTLRHDAVLQLGDRIQVTAPKGTGIGAGQVLTVSSIDMRSLAPALSARAMIEETAVERYAVKIERWDDASGSYLEILSTTVQVVTGKTTARAEQRGAQGAMVLGTLIFEPAPVVKLTPGDSVLGIPWATGATLTRLRPIVGSRLEATFSYTIGDAS